MEQTIYKIQDRQTGDFYGAGLRKSKSGKTWATLAHVKSAIKCSGRFDKNRMKLIEYKCTGVDVTFKVVK